MAKNGVIACLSILMVLLPYSALSPAEESEGEIAQEYIDRTVSINCGLKSVQSQTWDGRVMVSEGRVMAFPTPLYSQGQFGIYNQRMSKTSWKMRKLVVLPGKVWS